MDIKNEFVVPLNPTEAWRILLDIKRIIPCVPGAELIEVLDEQTYKGKVSVKLGPVALSFVGTAKFEELDEAAKKAKVLAKGSDAKGRGGATSVVQFRLESIEGGTKVIVDTNVNLSGSVAQYGRGTGVIQGVASQLTTQFAQNLKAMLAHDEEMDEPTPPVPAAAAPESGSASLMPPVSDGAQAVAVPANATRTARVHAAAPAAPFAGEAPVEMLIRMEAAAARAESAAARVEAAAARLESTTVALKKAARSPAPPIPQAKPISGLSLMFTVLWGMVTGVFSRKKNI